MKKGQQQEPLQDHIERLEDEINDARREFEEHLRFAPGCVRRAQPYRAHLGHKWAAKCVLEHILSHTGELQEELNRMYDEAFTDFMTDFVAQPCLGLIPTHKPRHRSGFLLFLAGRLPVHFSTVFPLERRDMVIDGAAERRLQAIHRDRCTC